MSVFHPLKYPWTFSFKPRIAYKQQSERDWLSDYKTIYEIKDIERFWGVYNNIPCFTEMPHGSIYAMFRNNIHPSWEHSENQKGFSWILYVNKYTSKEWVRKIYENSLRAVNIAYANEMAIVMQNLKLDAKEVIGGVKTKPFGLDLCFPGPGVGGHCIPVDPFYLIEESQKRGFDPSFLRRAMRVNNYMPTYTVSLLTHAMNDVGKSVNGSTIGILGVSYKKNVGDLRESPALDIIKKIKRLGGVLKVYDPYVASHTNATVEDVMRCDAVMLLTNHDTFSHLDFSNVPVVIDGRNVIDKKNISGVYKGIGR